MNLKKRYALGVEYDGSRFYGWQMQSHGTRTVQEVIQSALSQIADHSVETVCAGRTDTGVHATMQVVHFETHSERDEKAWVMGVNTLLPDDVAIKWVRMVDDEFSARFSATMRSYRYVISNSMSRPAIHNTRVAWIYDALDSEAMHDSAQALLGEQDFSAFRSAHCQASHANRLVRSVDVMREDEYIYVDISANAFLHHMVRNIVGSLLVIGRGQEDITWIGQLLEMKDRNLAGATAPASGLYLIAVEYPDEYELPTKGWLPRFGHSL